MKQYVEELRHGKELTSVELKCAGTLDMLIGKLAKAALGFANSPNGGKVIVGVKENTDSTIEVEGLTPEQFQSFKIRELEQLLSSYGTPPTRVVCDRIETDDGKILVGISIAPFDGRITVCKNQEPHDSHARDKKADLQVGVVYVRKQEYKASARASSDDMSRLLDDAITSRLLQHIDKLVAANVLIVNPVLALQNVKVDGRYDEELADF